MQASNPDQPTARILLIEDQVELATIIQYMFQGVQVAVTAARSGELGLQLARRSKFDLILLDWHLPGMNGLEVCRALKLDEQLADIPVIFASSNQEPETQTLAHEAGALEFFVKPFDLRLFTCRIMNILSDARPELFAHMDGPAAFSNEEFRPIP